MTTTLHPAAQAVRDVAVAHGLAGDVVMLSDAATTAQLAADQLGCDVAAIANSLIFAGRTHEPGPPEPAEDQPILVLASGGRRIDVALVSETIGIELRRADPAFVKRHTGQTIGGVAPVGHPDRIRTFVDRDLARHQTLWTGGGVPHAVIAWTYADLLRLTDGTEISVV